MRTIYNDADSVYNPLPIQKEHIINGILDFNIENLSKKKYEKYNFRYSVEIVKLPKNSVIYFEKIYVVGKNEFIDRMLLIYVHIFFSKTRQGLKNIYRVFNLLYVCFASIVVLRFDKIKDFQSYILSTNIRFKEQY